MSLNSKCRPKGRRYENRSEQGFHQPVKARRVTQLKLRLTLAYLKV